MVWKVNKIQQFKKKKTFLFKCRNSVLCKSLELFLFFFLMFLQILWRYVPSFIWTGCFVPPILNLYHSFILHLSILLYEAAQVWDEKEWKSSKQPKKKKTIKLFKKSKKSQDLLIKTMFERVQEGLSSHNQFKESKRGLKLLHTSVWGNVQTKYWHFS